MVIRKGSPVVKNFFFFALFFLIILGVFFSGFSLGKNENSAFSSIAEGKVLNKEASPPYLLRDVDFKFFWEVWKIIQEKYVGQPVLDSKIFYGALKGMVSGLGDPHSVFLDPELMKKFEENLSGTFSGIGAELGIKNKKLTIIAPLPTSPAEKAGIKAKDWIVKIEKEDTLEMSVEEAVTKIRGPKGTKVTLTIMRDGFDEPKEFTIARNIIVVQSVKYEEKKPFAYIKIIDFDEHVIANFNKVIEKLIQKKPSGIILDLRNNPGGLLGAAIEVTSAWLKKGDVVVQEERQGGRREASKSSKDGVLRDMLTVILVNEGSASASEILAGALQDYNKAKLIGEKTFGKGSVQELQKLRDGSAVKITIAKWLTPKGRQIHEVGIKPDYEVKISKEDFDKDKDPQLDKAIEVIKGLVK
jgi:carboxyl-terminal processing protease